jgi:uncharacterized iron-regulated membrane protein
LVTDFSPRDVILGLLGAVLVAAVVVALVLWLSRRMGNEGGFPMVARCLDGHEFRAALVPVFMLPVPRVGLVQFRYCPVGQHWTFVVLVRA